MRTNSRRGAHALTMVVLTAAVSLSGRVEAQQTGLLPLAPIRRQRVPCDHEDPTYKIYKQQYFGYHPTCWRTFPAGWGCPSAEAPNRERSFRELPPGNIPDEEAGEMLPPEERGAPPVRRPEVPGLPRERDPFAPDEGMPNARPLPGGNPPRTAPPRADDPFRDLNRPGASISPPRNGSQARSAPPMPDDGAPELTAPSRSPAQGSAARSAQDGEDTESVDSTPVLGLADSDIVRSDAASSLDSQTGVPATAPSTEAAASAPASPAQPRRRIFGNLFSSLGSNWLRR
jgi:hypothetical protein